MFVWFCVFLASWLVSLSVNYPPQSLVSIVAFASCVILCPDKEEKFMKLNILSSNVTLKIIDFFKTI